MAFSAHKDEKTMKEHYDSDTVLHQKVIKVAEMIKQSKHTCFFTGAGISTDAGIPDFRGPNGVWTCKAKRIAAPRGTSTLSAIPTTTHMSILQLLQTGNAHYLISQNCDGLHRRSGVPAHQISELHGNSNIEYCEDCGFQYLRDYACYRITRSSDHYTGRHCVNKINGTTCNGRLLESTIDFGQSLPEIPLQRAYDNSKKANLHIALGSSLTVSPACTMPERTAKNSNGALVICNLQNTPLDYLCKVRVFQRCDVFMKALMKQLNLTIPPFQLNRRFKLTRFIEKGKHGIKIGGIEEGTNGQEIPATLAKSVEIFHNDSVQRVTIQHLNQIPTFEVPEIIEKLCFRVHTMQHYAEPPLEFEIDPSALDSREFTLSFAYLPSIYKWKVIEEQSSVQMKMLDSHSEQQIETVDYSLTTKKINIVGCVPDPRMWATLSKVSDENNGCSLLLAGGISDGHGDTLMNFRKSTWTPFPVNQERRCKNLPYVHIPRWGHAAAVVELKFVFLFGGWDSTSQYNDMWLLDTVEHTLDTIPCTGTIPSARAGHSFTLVYSLKSLFSFGGSCCNNGIYEFYNDLYSFDPMNHVWKQIQTKGEIPSPRSQHSAVLLDNQTLLIIGGYNGKELLNDIYLLDLRTFEWKKIIATGDLPETKVISTKPYRVYPALHGATRLTPNNRPQVFYTGESGVHLLDVSSWKWTKPHSLCAYIRAPVCVSSSDVSVVALGESTDEKTNEMFLFSISA